MPYITSSHFVGNTDTRSAGCFGAEGSLLLNDDNDPVAYSRMLGLFSHDRNAFYDGCSGIVDAIEERLKLSEKPIR